MSILDEVSSYLFIYLPPPSLGLGLSSIFRLHVLGALGTPKSFRSKQWKKKKVI